MQQKIESLWADQAQLQNSTQAKATIESVISQLENGEIRVCEKINEEWITNEWIKKAILMYFKIRQMEVMEAGALEFYDKMKIKTGFEAKGIRVVPPAVARYGSFIAQGVILMPSYVNIGAYIDSGTMVDTWATVGSCAQIGKNVHLSGGVGIGGVLEPLQANPVIIENGAFIGSRCIIVEGALVGEEAVLGAGVTITSSTKIMDVSQNEVKHYTGFVPPRSVVIPGTYPKEFPAGIFHVPCALIIGQRKPSTDLKVSLNDVLRDHQIAV